MKMKKIKALAALTASVLFLCSCSDSTQSQYEESIVTWLGTETLYEDGAFKCISGTDDGNKIMYYSAEADAYVPICTKPDCTHSKLTSPDCNALVNYATAIVKKDDGLYFFDQDIDSADLMLIHSDVNGTNRRTVATIKNGMMYTVVDYSYSEDYVLLVYYDMMGLDEMEEGDTNYHMVDEYTDYIVKIDLNSGEAELLLKKKDNTAQISKAIIYGNKLIYNYWYSTKGASELEEGEYMQPYMLEEIYCLDLETGEEQNLTEGYTKMGMVPSSFDHFDPERLIFVDYKELLFYLYNLDTGEMTMIDKCTGSYSDLISDYEYIIYSREEDDEEFCCYNFETGETVIIPRNRDYYIGLGSGYIVGETVWVTHNDEDGMLCRGYISRDDFLKCDFSSFKAAYSM